MHYDEDYFDQLTAEQCITRFTKGVARRVWELKKGKKRNEALDLFYGNYAAMKILDPDFRSIQQNWAGWTDMVSGNTPPTRGRRVRSRGLG